MRLGTGMVFFVCVTGPGWSQIILTEIMANPDGPEQSDEFVEVRNIGDTRVSLQGWRIGDGSDTDAIVEAGDGFELDPGRYAVILDPDGFAPDGSRSVKVPDTSVVFSLDGRTFGSGGLSNSRAEHIRLFEPGGRPVDSVWTDPEISPGFSLERVTWKREEWCPGLIPGGTPGSRNSVAPAPVDLAMARLEATPNTQEGFVRLSASVLNRGLQTVSAYRIQVWLDLDGDSAGTPGETIDWIQSTGSVIPGDSLTHQISWRKPPGGNLRVRGRVSCFDDGRPDNDEKTVRFFIASETDSVVINEIQYQPCPGDPEWVEIFNGSSRDFMLTGWRLSDDDTSRFACLDFPLLLCAGDYAVLASEAFHLSAGNVPGIPDEFPSLNNGGDTVLLMGSDGGVVDSVTYEGAWSTREYASLERVSFGMSSCARENWSSSLDSEGGTPWRINSVSGPEPAGGISLVLDPPVFSPDGDGWQDGLRLTYHVPCREASIYIRIFDVSGRRIRDLVSGMRVPGEGAAVWNGLDDKGRTAAVGLYIVLLEALDFSSGTLYTVKRVAVLAAAL